ncbi:hypothetical protein KsCSTR_05150 [Candidatus Kuenenia stuttgartiensis]|uniref:Methyltransferase domain-containing protein n=2 Tax=Kuenenia stuttgartiensis TaxID=174633 RepID=Q1Q059_KUEST|nr:hypothetical protein KsCSTR_05150 [Candidatus Kuenenia stuttgartiensis]GJQ50004.1 MAG: hypothetical protein HKUEN01_23900 [Candidatus Kuenenia stuttgartiensis]CAJ72727.1 hypothetical protein kustd1982 [Candidatus Kuenenia stuttgartiensis]
MSFNMTKRKDHWERVYSDKSPFEVSWYQNEPSVSLRLIENCQLEKNEPVIDVGGGASVLVDRLLEKGYTRLAALDISSKALDFARNRLGNKAQYVEWFETDITEFSSRRQFSLWHDRAVFHFLTDPGDREKYVEILGKTLRPGGYCIIAAFAVGGPMKCSGLNVVQYNAEKISDAFGGQFELIGETGETHITPAKKEQLFSYFSLLRK